MASGLRYPTLTRNNMCASDHCELWICPFSPRACSFPTTSLQTNLLGSLWFWISSKYLFDRSLCWKSENPGLLTLRPHVFRSDGERLLNESRSHFCAGKSVPIEFLFRTVEPAATLALIIDELRVEVENAIKVSLPIVYRQWVLNFSIG